MKNIIIALSLMASLSSLAATVQSEKNIKINVARIDKVVTLVDKTGLKVNVVVEDTGGSTDVSPTQNLYFTLYSKGEMADVEATFKLGPIYSLTSATRISGGVYQIKAMVPSETDQMPTKRTLTVNAANAIVKIKAINCEEEFECDAAKNFSASIDVK